MVEFNLGVDVKTAVQDVRDKVAGVRTNFSKDVGDPPSRVRTTTTTSPSGSGDEEFGALLARAFRPGRAALVVKRLQGSVGVGTVEFPVRSIAKCPSNSTDKMCSVPVEQVVGAIRSQRARIRRRAFSSVSVANIQMQVQGKLAWVERIIVARRGVNGTSTPSRSA